MKISEITEDVSRQAAAQAFGDIATALRKNTANPVDQILQNWDSYFADKVQKNPEVKKSYSVELQSFVQQVFGTDIAQKLNIKQTVRNGKPNTAYIKSFFKSAIQQTKKSADTAVYTAKPTVRVPAGTQK